MSNNTKSEKRTAWAVSAHGMNEVLVVGETERRLVLLGAQGLRHTVRTTGGFWEYYFDHAAALRAYHTLLQRAVDEARDALDSLSREEARATVQLAKLIEKHPELREGRQ